MTLKTPKEIADEAYTQGFKAGSTGAMTREEVCESERRHYDDGEKHGYAQGFRTAIEKAAMVADELFSSERRDIGACAYVSNVSRAIRSLPVEEK